jgi:hypothetical protein
VREASSELDQAGLKGDQDCLKHEEVSISIATFSYRFDQTFPMSSSTARENLAAKRASDKDSKKRNRCPLKTDDGQSCPECVFKKEGPDQFLHCHCGKVIKMIRGRIQTAETHWNSSKCWSVKPVINFLFHHTLNY